MFRKPKKIKNPNEPIVIEFNLSKAVIILIIIGIIISAITTVKVISTIQDIKMNKALANENGQVDELTNEDIMEDHIISNSNSANTSYISINSDTISLQEEVKTKLNIINVFNNEEIKYDDLTIDWITESNDGGEIEVKKENDNLYVYGKKVGTVNLKARVNYENITIESNAVTIYVKEQLDPYYQKVTMFKYYPKELFELAGATTDIGNQGIYFSSLSQISDDIEFDLSDWNKWNRESPNSPYTGLVENNLDANGNIVFTKPDGGIFDISNTNGKEIYTNVGIPLKALGNGFYQFKSSEMEVNFENGVPQSNVNMVCSDTKNSYLADDDTNRTGFFPFNSTDGEEAIYHFGMHAQIPFYMTKDGKANIGESEDIVFEVSGDDDIWIFIDGKLVVDLGGIHNEISADINFATGEVIIYDGTKSTNNIASTNNLKDILEKDWNNNTEKQHKMDVFYLERGGGSSNCTISFNMPMEVQTSNVTVHHYIDGTTEKLVEDEIIEGVDGDLYRTSPSKDVPPMYEVVKEKIPENAVGIIIAPEKKEVTYYYKLKEESSIEKEGTVQLTSLDDNIDYNISYNSAIKYYVGDVKIKIVDKLPLKINEDESNLDNGLYDDEKLTITWSGTYNMETGILVWDNSKLSDNEDVVKLPDGNIQINKKISLKYKEISLNEGTTIPNNIEGTLESQGKLIETVKDTFETTTNFKTKIVVEKKWVGDTEAQRPPEITIKLLSDGNEQQTVILNAENSWTTTFENLDKYNEAKKEIEYSVEESVPEGYYLSNTEKTDIEGGEKYVLTNFKYGDIKLTKVAKEDNTFKLAGTEFKLYKFKGDNNQKDEVIDKDNVPTDWELIGTCTTKEDGIIQFENLEKTAKYRLIETKASDGRELPKGQWKIEFIYGDFDKEDKEIKNINGTLLKITEIGNTPKLIETDEGELLLTNSKIYTLPLSGDFGINTFGEIGIILFTIGFSILIMTKIIKLLKRRI